MNTENRGDPTSAVLEFHSSRVKALLLTAGLAAIAALAAAAALIAPSMWPWLGTAYFGVGAIMVFCNGLFRPATLRIDADGLHFAHWRHTWAITWNDIADVRLYIVRINWCRVSQNVVLRDRAGTKRTVSSGLTITPDKLADLIRRRQLAAFS